MSAATLMGLLPVLIPAVGGLWILVQVAILQKRTLRWCAGQAILVLAFGVAADALLWRSGAEGTMLDAALVLDRQTLAFSLLFLLVAALTVLISLTHLESLDWPHGEFYALLLFAVSGMTIMAGTENLLSLFIGLEVLSIPLYILAGFTRDRVYAIEAALKYFLLGAFSTGVILYGIARLYGASGGALLLIGLAFKIAAVPFHFWAPDVYQGSLAPVAGFMAAGTKAAAFAAFVRVVAIALNGPPAKEQWIHVTTVVAILTMVIGNLVALAQQNIKRMLAYSSIANAGYLLVALAAVGRLNIEASSIAFYLFVYAFMTIGAFAVAAILGRDGEADHAYALTAYAGLGRRRPLLAAAMTVFMLSLTGIPPAAGFMAKFYIFRDAVRAGLVPLAAVGVLASVVGAFYYLRVVVQMYFREPAPEPAGGGLRLSATDVLAIGFAAIAVLYLGLFPNVLLTLVRFGG
jgi:NADH-quinone oxidoreductase subunit N